MSGIEVTGLVLGVLPLLVEAVKAYSKVSEGLHTFRHWSREVRSISRQLKVQNGLFRNECCLLLRLVKDEKVTDDTLDDELNQHWLSEDFDKVNPIADLNIELCRSIVEETKNVIDDMREEMRKFDTLQEQKQKNEKIKSTIKRLRGAAAIAFDKSKYEKCINSLRDRNDDLKALRLQMVAFQQPSLHAGSTLVRHEALPTCIQSIQNASQKLHEALCNAWCCDDATHREHYAKLCLEAEVATEVRLDLAISCLDASTEESRSLSREPPIWLYVQSMSMASTQCLMANPIITVDKALTLPLKQPTSPAAKSPKKKASKELTASSACKKKAKRVHFVGSNVDESQTLLKMSLALPPAPPDVDLRQTKNICHYLKRKYRTCDATVTKNCVGYLETPELYKHIFFAKNTTPEERKYTTVHSIFDVMGLDVDDSLDVVDQYKLAHKTALAVLQYNNTPWLSDHWRLSNMSYFGNKQNFDELSLKTLHLSSQISSPAQSNMVFMDGIECVDTEISDEIRYGINNLPLFFLGIALLEIAHWKPLEEKMTVRDANDRVYAARRLADGRSPLGTKYQQIAQKCLQCNFGFGTKLSNKGLQAAVYNDVVCELEGMIKGLSLKDG